MGGMLVRDLLRQVFERVGDGTATTVVLTRALVHDLDRISGSGGNVRQLERGLSRGLESAVESPARLAEPIAGAAGDRRVVVRRRAANRG